MPDSGDPPQPWRSFKENIAEGVTRTDRLLSTWVGVTLAGYPANAVLMTVPGVSFEAAFAVFAVASVAVTGAIVSYRPSIIEHLHAFGAVAIVGFATVGWLLWSGFGPHVASWQTAGEGVLVYLTVVAVAYLLTYRRWYARGKVRLRLAVRRRTR